MILFKKSYFVVLILVAFATMTTKAKSQNIPLKIVIIQHGEKPDLGDNLTCKGLNRSTLLPAVIKSKFGIPDYVYVPSPVLGTSTGHSRMFQTILPLAIKYNLKVNTTHPVNDYLAIYKDLSKKTGTVLVCWEHLAIAPLVRTFKLKVNKWPDDDFDSIWIISFSKGVATLTLDKESLKPGEDCFF
jgi:hypothetical protein